MQANTHIRIYTCKQTHKYAQTQTFSASAFSNAATRMRLAALISFMASYVVHVHVRMQKCEYVFVCMCVRSHMHED
jgi:hypothetical protein